MNQPVVLQIGPHPYEAWGGVSSVISNILGSRYLDERFEMKLYSSFIGDPLPRRVLYSVYRELRFIARVPEADVYHIHICTGTSTWRKMRYVRQLGAKANRVVLHVHGARYHTFYEQCTESQKKKIRSLYASVSKIILLSEWWRDWFVSQELCDPRKIEVLYNAVEIPEVNRIDYTLQTVLFMGRLGERKSPDVLLNAAARVIPNHPSARFVFGGDGDVEVYRKLAADLGIAGNCEFLGWVSGEEREHAYVGASIYCLPSKDEGMPMSVLEAMSYGLATISTPVGGIPEVIDDDVDGLLCPVDDVDALAQNLDMLLSSVSERRRLGEAARCKVSEKFAVEAYSRRLARIYEEVCS